MVQDKAVNLAVSGMWPVDSDMREPHNRCVLAPAGGLEPPTCRLATGTLAAARRWAFGEKVARFAPEQVAQVIQLADAEVVQSAQFAAHLRLRQTQPVGQVRLAQAGARHVCADFSGHEVAGGVAWTHVRQRARRSRVHTPSVCPFWLRVDTTDHAGVLDQNRICG